MSSLCKRKCSRQLFPSLLTHLAHWNTFDRSMLKCACSLHLRTNLYAHDVRHSVAISVYWHMTVASCLVGGTFLKFYYLNMLMRINSTWMYYSTTLRLSYYHINSWYMCLPRPTARMCTLREGNVTCIIPLQHSCYSWIMLTAHISPLCWK